ncbi:dihydrodipicolinate synthase family protein [uncultured Aquabacterium sp.]|uniref:dihydrodipicolinate synthase family protein n=1 Tax=uncultured Aquabacterium sp. TaxID=158753 RepID=UPI0030CA6E20
MGKNLVIVPMVTPLQPSGDVCEQSVQQLIAYTRGAVDAYLPCLTSGEGWLLSEPQWVSMVACAVAEAQGKPVIAGIERSSTDEVLRYARKAQSLGATGVMLTSPFGPDVDQASIVAHYRRVHDACDLDIYIYNESSLSGNEISFESLLEIAILPRVVGIKDSAEGEREAHQIRALQDQGLVYLIGWEHLLARGIPADGNVVSLSNLSPTLCRLACRTDAEPVQAEIARLCEHHGLAAPDWYRHVKHALKQWGVILTERTVEAS